MVEMQRNDLGAATQLAEQAVHAQPATSPAHLVLARSLVARGELDSRRPRSRRRLPQSSPGLAGVQNQVGMLALAKGDKAALGRPSSARCHLNGFLSSSRCRGSSHPRFRAQQCARAPARGSRPGWPRRRTTPACSPSRDGRGRRTGDLAEGEELLATGDRCRCTRISRPIRTWRGLFSRRSRSSDQAVADVRPRGPTTHRCCAPRRWPR